MKTKKVKQRTHKKNSKPKHAARNPQSINQEKSNSRPLPIAYHEALHRPLPSFSTSKSETTFFPPPFPDHLPRPTNDFLRCEPPFIESYETALKTAYEGFAVDKRLHSPPESRVQEALQEMLIDQYFRRDVTQPFGLGTKCAKTYVTRCLLGEPGTTYKYLGLRMFAHPWNSPSLRQKGPSLKGFKDAAKCNDIEGESATRTIQNLGQILSQRTKTHLRKLNDARNERGAPPTKGRSIFDICLINRMESSPDLKTEPTLNLPGMKTSVSWHADSSLEHYSTIAVYQTLVGNDPALNDLPHQQNSRTVDNATAGDDKISHQWYVALRVAHNSEGPQASHRGSDIDSAIVKKTPPIAASLPSGSSYYLLDDFNHHHQHTVLCCDGDVNKHHQKCKKQTKKKVEASSPNRMIRYSCTYRLLRDSHNVEYILKRCQSAVSNFHKKGSKLWRSEQLLLTELESEWIRQFYIQGTQHFKLLTRAYWKEPLQELLKFWNQLECRTKQTIDVLRLAAEGSCEHQTTATTPTGKISSRAERKIRERQKKALVIIQDLMNRSEARSDALVSIYEPFADLLDERAKMRELWGKREKDHAFSELETDCRPMQLPFRFESSIQEKVIIGGDIPSPLPGQPALLREMAASLRKLGRAFESGLKRDLPGIDTLGGNATNKPHEKPLDWIGWSSSLFGLELQEPWASAIVEGRKKIETRAYTLPPALLHKRIWILQSPEGKPGISGIGDFVELAKSEMKIAGWCTFKAVTKYTNQASFWADEGGHLVKPESGYGWKEGTTKVIYGWVVEEYQRADSGTPGIDAAVRRMRSLFELKLQRPPNLQKKSDERSLFKKKRKRKRY